MPVYLDDDSAGKSLKAVLRRNGVDVVCVNDAGTRGAIDSVHFEKSKELGRRIVTKNRRDFMELADEDPDHPGVYIWPRGNNKSKDMTWKQVAGVITVIEREPRHWQHTNLIVLTEYLWLISGEPGPDRETRVVEDE